MSTKAGWFSKIAWMTAVLFALAFGLAGCAAGPSTASTRPTCVTLAHYNMAIQQVMGVTPQWEPVFLTGEHYQAVWAMKDRAGFYRLTARLTAGGCVCATEARGQISSASTQGDQVGLLMGAAVAPVSELNDTASWLEPKILMNCALAMLSHKDYSATTVMSDGARWELACGRGLGGLSAPKVYTLKVTSSRCPVDANWPALKGQNHKARIAVE